MKQFTKCCLKVAAVLGIIGILGVGAGLMLGGRPVLPGKASRLWYETAEKLLEEKTHKEESYRETASGGRYGTEIRRMELDLANADVQISTDANTDVITVQAENSGQFYKEKTEDGDTLTIEDQREVNSEPLKLVIVLPERMLDELELDLAAGELTADRLRTKSIELDMGAGSGSIEELLTEKDAEITVGAGELEIGYFRGRELNLECGTGNLELCAEGTSADYNYSLECGIGSITLEDRSYSGVGREEYVDNQADREIDADCGIGTITLKFSGEVRTQEHEETYH